MLLAPPTTSWAAAQPPVLLAGRVAVDGVSEAGVDVQVLAWPSSAHLAGLRSGAAVTRSVLARVRTDAAGRFTVRVDPASVPAGVVESDGTVNVDVVAVGPDRGLVWSVPVRRVGARWRSVSPTSAASATGVPDLAVDLGRASGVADRNDPPVAWVGQGSSRLTGAGLLAVPTHDVRSLRALVGDRPAAPAVGCVATALSSYYSADESFAAVYAWSGAKATVYQVNGTTHVLGVGLKSSAGVWSANGTVSFQETKGAGASVPGVADAYAHNSVQYRDYFYSYPCSYTQRRPYATLALLNSFTYAPHVNFTHCATMYAGGSYWKDSGTDVTYGGGTDIGPISVSAQSGWTSSTKLTWNITTQSQGCGSTTGWVSAPTMDVRA